MAGNNPTQPPRDFSLFPKLPFEMRLKIWNSALEEELHREGRIVEVRWSHITKRYISDNPTPVLLRTCRDSRSEARKALKLLAVAVEISNPHQQVFELTRLGFDTDEDNNRPFVTLFRTYFDFDRDTIFLSHHHFGNRFLPAPKLTEFLSALNDQRHVAEKLRYLAFGFSESRADVQELGARMFNMKALEMVTFVFDDKCCSRSGGFRSSVQHKELVKFEEIKFPDAPLFQPHLTVPQWPLPPANHNHQAPGSLLFNGGGGLNHFPQHQNAFTNHGFQQPFHQHNFNHQIPAPGTAVFNGAATQLTTHNPNLTPLFMLSDAEKHALKIQALWHELDDGLVSYLEESVADRMADTQGQAREEWGMLQTRAVTAVRVTAVRGRENGDAGLDAGKRSPFEGYEVLFNGRRVRG